MTSVETDWRNLRVVAEAMHGLQKHRVGVRVVDGKLRAEQFAAQNSFEYVLHTDEADHERQAIGKAPFPILLPGLRIEGVTLPKDYNVYDHADAIFWSLAAVEKFLVPYYSTFWELQNVLDKIYLRFRNYSEVLAFIHLPNSEPSEGEDDGTRILNALFAMTPDTQRPGAFVLTSII